MTSNNVIDFLSYRIVGYHYVCSKPWATKKEPAIGVHQRWTPRW
jgi:hypothetical protein